MRTIFLIFLFFAAGMFPFGCGEPTSLVDAEPFADQPMNEEPADPSVEDGQLASLSNLPDNWRDAVYREACYALSSVRYNQGRWGESTRTVNSFGVWFAGDWDYVNNDPGARDAIFHRYSGATGGWGYWGGYGRGGWCKVFVDLLLYRGTGNRYRLPSGYSYATGNIGDVRPGDIIQGFGTNGTPHTAICFAILTRDGAGKATQIDVIDSNFITGNGNFLISRHKLPGSDWPLSNFRVW